MPLQSINRRLFLGSASAALTLGSFARADERLAVTHPRATDGDAAHEPNWDERLSITVGHKDADLVGTDDRAIQAAVDYVARLGEGTVHILPGTYALRNAVLLASGIRILGSGAESIVTKIPSDTVKLSEDSDWYDQEITLDDSQRFRVGDGVVLRATNPHHGGPVVLKRTLVARSGNRFKLNDGLRENLWTSGAPTCSSLFPLFTSEHTSDVVIENITLDGNRQQNENFDGNYGGCIFLQDCNRYTIRGVTTRNYNGDGISFQICHDVIIENCHSHDNQDLGIHPGSGSQRPVIRDNTIERNGIGLFWCWGVKYGLAQRNRIDCNRNYGISIGHNDTDNVMLDNDVSNSGKVGVLFRDESRGKDFWPNRNVLRKSRIVNSGDATGVAIDIQGKTRDLTIEENEIREERAAMRRIGIRINRDARNIKLVGNIIRGVATDVVDEMPRGC